MSSQIFRRLFASALPAALLLSVGVASAHIDLTAPVGRNGARGTQKNNPCDGVAKGMVTPFKGGETIKVKFTETVDHDGNFLISVDPTGDDFDGDGDGTGDYPGHPLRMTAKNGNGNLVLATIEGKDGQNAMYEADVTLPNISCDPCALQLIQMMGEPGKEPADDNDTGHIYFRCADITITAAPDMGAGGAGGAGGAPSGGAGGATDGGAANGGAPAIGGAGGVGPEPDPIPAPTATAEPVPPMPVDSPAPVATGGASPTGVGGAAPTGAPPPAAPSDEGGCSLAAPGPTRGVAGASFSILALLGLAWRGRRRS